MVKMINLRLFVGEGLQASVPSKCFFLRQNGNFIWMKGCVYTCIITIEFEMRLSVAVFLVCFPINSGLFTIHVSTKQWNRTSNEQVFIALSQRIKNVLVKENC